MTLFERACAPSLFFKIWHEVFLLTIRSLAIFYPWRRVTIWTHGDFFKRQTVNRAPALSLRLDFEYRIYTLNSTVRVSPKNLIFIFLQKNSRNYYFRYLRNFPRVTRNFAKHEIGICESFREIRRKFCEMRNSK